MSRRSFTTDEDGYILTNYQQTMSITNIAQELERTPSSIGGRVFRLRKRGLMPTEPGARYNEWSMEAEDWLYENWRLKPKADLSSTLGRSEKAVVDRAYIIGAHERC